VTAHAWALLAAYLALLLALAWPVGVWIARLADATRPLPLELPLLRLAGVDPAASMGWKRYAGALLAFNAVGLAVVYALQRLQGVLPLNPDGMGAVAPDSAFDTAISFVSNTNWQGYGGESTMSHLTQMAGLGVQNFVSAATGIGVVFALIRGFAARGEAVGKGVGNFWVDLVRLTVHLLLPLALALAVALVGQGVVQNHAPSVEVATLEGATQRIPGGPAASQIAIKQLGTNGGGFFNANSAHPFENPTPLSNLLQMLSLLLIPAALCVAFGRMVGDRRQGLALLAAMTVLFVAFAVPGIAAEQAGNPRLAALGADAAASDLQPGGNMEGKEARFGIADSALWAAATTAASNGSVNSMHDSYTPLGGLVPLVLMQLGEVVFGGVGSGLYGMLVFAVVAVFVAGLMIGRTPEYLGKKIEPFEMKMASLVLLATPVLVLLGTALAVSVEPGRTAVANPGAHGFSEILYALSSAANNNGSAFAGLSANTPFWNALLGVAMFLGRFVVVVAVLALAGSLAAKPRLPPTPGTLPTHGPLFVCLLIGTVLLVGLLNYVPALALGPVVEHFQLWTPSP
jgi:K+-transporting ATPase ATPase A chain